MMAFRQNPTEFLGGEGNDAWECFDKGLLDLLDIVTES